ncbi:MAG: septal ring lytic transglycosylase RlpA family protein [Gammaproteobacteria bacterium]|nr:septal ring lytic transglycosylase RlpA family protein [Gammaproteobacteria bacterium]
MFRRSIVIGYIVVNLSACTFGVPIGDRGSGVEVNRVPHTSKSKNGNPSSYVVAGKRYYVLNSADGFKQRGIASWYGKKFHGRKTSSGEVYNMYAMTAAHKTLPIPVYVRVKNLSNGRSVIVKVNDRGPFVEGRVIDLSYSAAQKIGITGPGTARVEIAALRQGRINTVSVVRSIPLPDDPGEGVPLFIQVGSFGLEFNAMNLMRELQDANERAVLISELKTSSGMFFRVRLGPLYDIDEANAIIRRLKGKGFVTARIVVKD